VPPPPTFALNDIQLRTQSAPGAGSGHALDFDRKTLRPAEGRGGAIKRGVFGEARIDELRDSAKSAASASIFTGQGPKQACNPAPKPNFPEDEI
jgi:hypothetical protein